MDDRQRMVCAIALFADGYSHKAIATALDVTEDEAFKLTQRGAQEQSNGTMGFMKTTRDKDGQPVQREDP